EFLDWDEIEELAKLGHEIGSHTMSHRRLSDLSTDEIQSELSHSKERLESRMGPIRHFAWPFGRFFHVDRRAVRATFDAGYETCASAERGAHVEAAGSDQRQLCIRRDQIVAAWPLDHVRYFLARSSASSTASTNAWPFELDPASTAPEIVDR
ncbi:MAG: polysaccharide deacetylase family protein, partial [Thermomicrobiales bacterium]|nr:polysaccharide deacetylase family protein [Thermomicrobiales bacterium]